MANVSIYCPHCKMHTALSIAKERRSAINCVWHDSRGDAWWIGVCNACKMPVLVFNEGDIVYPNSMPKPTNRIVPEFLKSDLDEAKMCMSVNAYRGAAVLARRTLQNACIDKGAKKRDLVDQIDELLANGVITKDINGWAHAVRWVGNDAAHPNQESVGKDEAEDILNLTEQLLEILYVTPTIASKYQKNKGKK